MKKLLLITLGVLVLVSSNAQNVGIGTNSPVTRLDVNATDNFVSKFNGPNQMYLGFFETGVLRGYLGSFAGATEDFDIGTSSVNTIGKLHLTTMAVPRMSVDATGNIGIGTTAPAPSSIVEMTSTAKGLLIPRMTTAQRTAIASPANGLLVYDINTNSFWYYNSSSWTNMAGSGSFTLPIDQTVNTGASAFKITNQGTGSALQGASSNQFGVGITAGSTGDFGWGLNAFTDKAGAVSIRSVADLGQAFYGENANATNANTLMYLVNKGTGRTNHMQLANATSTASNLYIAGNQLGRQIEVYQTNAANTLPAVYISNAGTGAGLSVVSANTTGIAGATTAGVGVRGDATTGTGLIGYSTSGYGLNASSISGTGIYTSSISGLALDVNGNLKIAGGNTTPGAGKVLTSDASGNATWQTQNQAPPQVGFRVYGVSAFATAGTPNNEFAHSTSKKVEFQTKSYDFTSDFSITGSSTATSSTSTYTIPVRGVYHFDAAVMSENNSVFAHLTQELRLQLNRNGTISTIAQTKTAPDILVGTTIQLSSDVFLEEDDVIWIEFQQNNLSFSSSLLSTSGIKSFFSGHLIYQR